MHAGAVLSCGDRGEYQFIKGKNMSKAVSLALLAGGIVLIVFGVMASTSFTSDISRFFTGSPTDKAIWMLLGGVMASIVGVVGLLRG
jgi:NO-binding membrane sensor protein with MHYT domain